MQRNYSIVACSERISKLLPMMRLPLMQPKQPDSLWYELNKAWETFPKALSYLVTCNHLFWTLQGFAP